MASWTSVVVKSTNIALKLLKNIDQDFDLIDVGSGKGKTLLVWSRLMKLSRYKIYGIEYNKDLLKICEGNLQNVYPSNIRLINADAAELVVDQFKKHLLVYLYNPFDAFILTKFLEKLERRRVVLIYNNPVHSDVIEKMGYGKVHVNDSWHPSGRFIIYQSQGGL